MTLIKPRLNDFFDLAFSQEQVDFAIPFLDEDIPLYIDPFLLFKSPSLQENGLHTTLTQSFNHLGYLFNKGKEQEALSILIRASECNEVGLGMSSSKKGQPIGEVTARKILALFSYIPQVKENGFLHFEEIQLFVDQISKDRISDITSTFLKSFLIDYTIQKCNEYKIPLKKTTTSVYNYQRNAIYEEEVYLPYNPHKDEPLILVPKRWLRFIPWISFENYFEDYFIREINNKKKLSRVEVLDFNRHNYDAIQTYIKIKERDQQDCKNDPLFKQIPILSAKRKLSAILRLPSGKENNADKKYEDYITQLIASLLYPQLDFAEDQSRTESGVQIRDLIFYNNRTFDFLQDIYDDYNSRQIVMELKNVKELEREHINQLNRYLKDSFGNFGIIITRNRVQPKILKNTIDLWSGQRKCILILDDEDIKQMVTVYESKTRLPVEVLKKKYIEFTRKCPC